MTDSAAVRDWLVAQLARELHLDPATISLDKPIAVLGLDSLAAATLSADLEDTFGCRLPETLLTHELTIAALSRIVASGDGAATVALASSEPAPLRRAALPPGTFDDWTLAQRVVRAFAIGIARALTRMDVAGADSLPRRGPVVIAVNHLHILDALWMFVAIPRRAVFIVAREFRNRPVVGLLLRIGHSIFVDRGAGDYEAIARAVDALGAGAAIGIAPEGKLSTTGGLMRGQPGLGRIAAEANAPVVPLALSGQERLWRYWRRGRRVPIRVRFGALIPPPSRPTTARALEQYSDAVMRALASALPPEYRGAYRDP